jgi:hypothetical protein
MAKKTDSELLQVISQEVQNSLGYYTSDLSEQRRQSLKYYLGEPYGNEMEGRSSVVTQELLETVESVLPSLMRMFTQSDRMVRFEPTQPEDSKYAESISNYCNHIFYKDNDGFNVLYDLFKTALLQKNGFCKIYWSTTQEQRKEQYRDLTEIEYNSLLLDTEVEITKVDEKTTEDSLFPVKYDVEVKRNKNLGRVKIESVPPEDILVSKRATSMKDCNFIAHRVYKTRSELIDMGYDAEIVNDLPVSDEEVFNTEAVTRRSYDDASTDLNVSTLDPSQAVVNVTECYLKVDMDGDGIAELRKVTVGGNGYNNYKLLENEEIPFMPITMVRAIPMPYRFFGLSFYDLIADIQAVSSTILRNTLDNMYFQNHARTLVVDGQANLDDLLTSRAGGVVRVKSPNAVTPMQTPNFLNEGLAMMKKIDEIKESRTGVAKQQMGLNADTINKSHTTATSTNQMMMAQTQRIELIARNFAEGVKDIFKTMFAIVCEYQEQERMIRINNEFVPMNPREWFNRYDVTVQVGLGTGNQDQRLAVLQRVLAVQEKMIMQGGLNMVTPQNIYNTLEQFLQNSGYKDASPFFNNPANVPPQPRQPRVDPALQVAQQDLQMRQQKAAADLELANKKLQVDSTIKAKKLDLEEQKLATQVIKDNDNLDIEKEKLASKIIQQGLN